MKKKFILILVLLIVNLITAMEEPSQKRCKDNKQNNNLEENILRLSIYDTKISKTLVALCFESISKDLDSTKILLKQIKIPADLYQALNKTIIENNTNIIWSKFQQNIVTRYFHIGAIGEFILSRNNDFIISDNGHYKYNIFLNSNTLSKTDISFRIQGQTNCSDALSNDGEIYINGTYLSQINIWNTNSGQHLKTLVGHGDSIEALAITSDCKYILSGSHDGTARIWDIETGNCIAQLVNNNWVKNNNNFFATDFQYGPNWNASQQEIAAYISIQAPGKPIVSVAISEDNSLLVTATSSTIFIWNAKTLELINKITPSLNLGIFLAKYLRISKDNKFLVSAGQLAQACIWDIKSGQLIAQCKEAETLRVGVNSIEISPDNKVILTTTSNTLKGEVCLWCAKTGKLIAKLNHPSRMLASASFSNDGFLIITSSNDNLLTAYSLSDTKNNLLNLNPTELLDKLLSYN